MQNWKRAQIKCIYNGISWDTFLLLLFQGTLRMVGIWRGKLLMPDLSLLTWESRPVSHAEALLPAPADGASSPTRWSALFSQRDARLAAFLTLLGVVPLAWGRLHPSPILPAPRWWEHPFVLSPHPGREFPVWTGGSSSSPAAALWWRQELGG